MSSDKVCLKRVDFTVMSIMLSVVTMHSVTDIQVPPVPIQPRTFWFHQRSFDFKKPEQGSV